MSCRVVLMILLTVSPALAQPLSENNAPQQVIVRVDGASCPFGAFGLEKRIGRIEGVQDVKMELKAGKAIVTLKEGATVSEDALRQAVKEAGFTAREITFLLESNSGQSQ